MKKTLIIIAIVIAVIGGLLWLGRDKSSSGGDSNNSTAQTSNHTYGNGSTKVVLMEYGDFQCPSCGAFFPIVKEVKEKYKDYITFQFMNFPLVQIHPNAMAAHRAAEAAAKQGKFWEMHDLLYAQQQQWSSSKQASVIFESYAQSLSLNMDQYKGDFISPDVNAVINADVEAGKKLGVNSTPTFYLDGKKIEDNRSIDTVEKFSALIDDAIKAKGGTPPTSTTPTQ